MDQPEVLVTPKATTKPRQAVVIIHGIGEQRPMETLRSFVLGVLGSAKRADGSRKFYSKPDPNADTFELRRYRAFAGRTDSDFVEFYWQHQMPIAAWRFLLMWLWSLMTRPVKAMPPRFVILWLVAWAAFALLAAALALPLLARLGIPVPAVELPSKLTGGAAIVAGAVGFVVRAFVGDAAIYLNPHPRTVEARNAIRSSGVALLERLHKDGRYDRIIVVGHSLGSVIGYDILSFAWHRASEEFRRKVEAGEVPNDPQAAFASAEALAASTNQPNFDLIWQLKTRFVAAETRKLGLNWLVSDFVTLGSPLAHASLLLARGPADFQRRVEERELPTAPPFRDDGKKFSFERKGPSTQKPRHILQVPDHAALFALTRWTNLYFPCRAFFYGDLVGGPIRPLFGTGVADYPVVTKVWNGWLAHTNYWSRYDGVDSDWNSSPVQLIDALDLDRRSFPRRPKAAGKDAADHSNQATPAP
jgi:hypothetical protein